MRGDCLLENGPGAIVRRCLGDGCYHLRHWLSGILHHDGPSETPGEIVARPPTLGEHTDLVLADSGYDTAAVAALRQSGII
jgi:crotonobetainyl-CoA:carnitine CoA-transferase CaiB-like acyl-CoA transferase